MEKIKKNEEKRKDRESQAWVFTSRIRHLTIEFGFRMWNCFTIPYLSTICVEPIARAHMTTNIISSLLSSVVFHFICLIYKAIAMSPSRLIEVTRPHRRGHRLFSQIIDRSARSPSSTSPCHPLRYFIILLSVAFYFICLICNKAIIVSPAASLKSPSVQPDHPSAPCHIIQ